MQKKHKNSKKNKEKQHISTKLPPFIWLYGKHSCIQALNNPNRKFYEILVTQNNKNLISEKNSHIPTYIVKGSEIEQQLPSDAVHQGIALKVAPLLQPDITEILSSNSNLVILDQVTDPHNIGAILRSAAAFDIAAVITTDRHAPDETSTLAKAASGALENTPLITVINLARTLTELKDYGYWIIGLDGNTDKSLNKINLPDKIAIILGAEGKGLRPLTRKHCDLLVKLPINSNRIESLNVSNAAAICLYEITRHT